MEWLEGFEAEVYVLATAVWRVGYNERVCMWRGDKLACLFPREQLKAVSVAVIFCLLDCYIPSWWM